LPRGAPGQPPLPDDLDLGPARTLTEVQQLVDAGLPFRAHEVAEAMWKHSDEAERDFWQGLAQLMVGLTHAERGNRRGAAALLRRGAERISGFEQRPPHGVDVTGLLAWARGSLQQIEATDGPVTLSRPVVAAKR
jgi:predicted metal-dependent hydrolase